MTSLLLAKNQRFPESCGAAALLTAIAERFEAPNFVSDASEESIFLALRDTETMEAFPFDLKLYAEGIRGKMTGSALMQATAWPVSKNSIFSFESVPRRFSGCDIIYDWDRAGSLSQAVPLFENMLRATLSATYGVDQEITDSSSLTDSSWLMSAVAFPGDHQLHFHWLLWRRLGTQIFVMDPDGGSNLAVSETDFANFFQRSGFPYTLQNLAPSRTTLNNLLNASPKPSYVLAIPGTMALNTSMANNFNGVVNIPVTAMTDTQKIGANAPGDPLGPPSPVTNKYLYLGLSLLLSA